jgi:hypothetical protein
VRPYYCSGGKKRSRRVASLREDGRKPRNTRHRKRDKKRERKRKKVLL